jgi:hypothetical protein
MSGAITPTVHYVLRKMADEEEEMICERNECWVGDHRTTLGICRKLLRIMAIKEVSDTKDGLQRYAINETGHSILRRPELGNEIFYAVFNGRSFTVREDRIVPLADPEQASMAVKPSR